MSAVVTHIRPSLLGRILLSIGIMVGGYLLATLIHCESVPQALWETLKEVASSLLGGVHMIVEAIRSAKL